ncbi:hypothetical protein C7402_121120 [Paraburkholderia unamae]|uniref:Uncharacterized protein n=1 Tax=Paraburkholderia unamae TaxID=219649 RepID=A0ABX5KF00_9BURK|nr:hypothetical protein C7402_121120 [Paraburkholderia unamae]
MRSVNGPQNVDRKTWFGRREASGETPLNVTMP